MKLLVYIALAIALIVTANFVYISSGLYRDDIKKCSAELVYDMDSAAATSTILYFGESSNFTFSETDSCKESIAQLTQQLNRKQKITAISKGAVYSPTYNCLIKRIPVGSPVTTIILTVNLRSFGINWIESYLETNLSRAHVMYSSYPPLVKKCMLSFKMYDNTPDFKRQEVIKRHNTNRKFKLIHQPYTSVRDWDRELFDKGVPDAHGNKDQTKTNLACHFIKNYAFTLNESNHTVKNLDEIVAFCKVRNIRLIFNLLPENYEMARQLCGIDLEILMRANVAFLKNRYAKSTYFIDNFYLLGDAFFIDRDWPTEHYFCYGRIKVAEKLNKQLNLIYE